MKADGYEIRHICPGCSNKSYYAQYGAASDIVFTLRRALQPKFCVRCANGRKSNMMEVLDVKCSIRELPDRKYHIAWMCAICCSKWSTYEQLKQSESIENISKNKRPECVICKAKPKNVRLIKMEQR